MSPVTKEQKEKFTKFQQEATYQSKVDLFKVKLQDMTKVQLAEALVQSKEEREALDAQTCDVNTRLEAIQQLLNAQLEDEGITSFRLPDGRLIYQQADVYVKVEDAGVFYAWLKEQPGGPDFFTVNYQTVASLTKSLIEKGEPVPVGLGVFIKESVRTRKA